MTPIALPEAPHADPGVHPSPYNPGMTESEDRGEATQILIRISEDPRASSERLFDLVYDMLRRLAADFLARERGDHTLQPTALVHEAYMKLIRQEEMNWRNEAHFMAIAAQAMRRILVDHARTKKRSKRGGDWDRVELHPDLSPAEESGMDLVRLDAVLDQLREGYPRQARVVEMRFFAGLPNEAIARALDVSERTVERDWRFARAWLTDAMKTG